MGLASQVFPVYNSDEVLSVQCEECNVKYEVWSFNCIDTKQLEQCATFVGIGENRCCDLKVELQIARIGVTHPHTAYPQKHMLDCLSSSAQGS